MGQRTSVYLDDDLHAAVKASGVPSPGSSAAAWPPEPPRRRSHQRQPRRHLPSAQSLAASRAPVSPAPAPGCWQRNTSCYGLRKLPLCPACAAAVTGQVYRREVL
jgi:hypothetical protein